MTDNLSSNLLSCDWDLSDGEQFGHDALGMLKSPQRMIFGAGVGRFDNDSFNLSRAHLNSFSVDRCPPVISSGCR